MAKSFTRCAGGKRLLTSSIIDLMPPAEAYDVYCEPFVGGGAVFFALEELGYLRDKLVILGDADADLIDLYEAVRDQPGILESGSNLLVRQARAAKDPEAFYKQQRTRWNAGDRSPSLHLFLRRACFNGLWRQNRLGQMNTPWKGEPPSLSGPDLQAAAFALDGVELLDWDFRRFEAEAEVEGEDHDCPVFVGPRTLVYADPPYLPGEGVDAFVGYTKDGWSESALVDLLTFGQIWSERGAHVVLSHSDTPRFHQLLAITWPEAVVHSIMARRSINSDGAGRGPVPEVLVVSRIDTHDTTRHIDGGAGTVQRGEPHARADAG